MKAHFYCQNLTGEVRFDIQEWNRVYLEFRNSGLSESDRRAILHPPACKIQCFDFMAIAGERQTRIKKNLK